MKQNNLPKYSSTLSAIEEAGLKLHPSQFHGVLAGILLGSKEALQLDDLKGLVSAGLDLEPIKDIFEGMCDASQKQLAEFLFEFELLLPDDEAPLQDRAEALTVWCQGFLTGLNIMDISTDELDGEVTEVKEAIGDMLEISKMNYEEVVASEEDEAAYIELVEYVRMAVILMYQEWHQAPQEEDPKESSSHLH